MAKLENGKIAKTIAGDFNCKQSCYIEIEIEKGEYLIFAENDNKNSPEIVVSCYSKHPVSVTDAESYIEV